MGSHLAGIAGVWPPFSGLAADADRCHLDGEALGGWAPALPRLGEVDGGFALAWVDPEGLHLARDAVGHRSLYWARRLDGAIVFGSRLREVVRRTDRRPRLLRPAVATYLAYAYVPQPATLVEGVYAVGPGEELVFSSGEAEPVRRRRWSLPVEPTAFEPEEQLRAELRRELERAVQEALPEGPVGAFLSGGIDSSLVVALAARRGPVRALSVSFGPGHANELEWSSLVSRHCGVEHHVVEVSAEAVRRHFDATVGALSMPNGDPLTVPNLLLFQAAAEVTGVVVNGEGGDPCFGGPKNAPMLLAQLYGEGGAEEAYLAAHQRCWEDLGEMLEDGLPSDHLVEELRPWFEDTRWPGLLNRLMAINITFKGAWHILPKVEHLGAARGVTARSPLFARRVVELSVRVPGQLKRAGAREKHLLKDAVADLLPASVVERPKSGMMVPVEAWFSGPLAGWARERLLDGPGLRGLVRRRWLERLIDGRLGSLRPRRGIKIWQLLTLESWVRSLEVA